MIGLEALIVFLAALCFSFAYFFKREEKIFGVLGFGCWIALSWLWLPLTYTPQEVGGSVYQTAAVALFWSMLGILLIIDVVIQYLHELRQKKLGESEDMWKLP